MCKGVATFFFSCFKWFMIEESRIGKGAVYKGAETISKLKFALVLTTSKC